MIPTPRQVSSTHKIDPNIEPCFANEQHFPTREVLHKYAKLDKVCGNNNKLDVTILLTN